MTDIFFSRSSLSSLTPEKITMMTSRSRLVKTLSALTFAGALSAGVFVSRDAAAQYPPPPPEFIATAAPVYYGGHPAYWYNNHWYYRDGVNWRWYDHEPPELYQRRLRGGPGRVVYGRGGGRPIEHGRR